MICQICNATIDETKIITATCFPDMLLYFNQQYINRNICDNCGLIFGPIDTIHMSNTELSNIYNNLYQNYSEVYNTADYFNFFHLRPEKNKKYLNYACGKEPKYLSQIRLMGYQIYGVDISLKIENEYLFRDFKNCPVKRFDGIVSHNYIEHLQDPIKWFSELNNLINIGDTMIHSTGAFEYVVERSPFHLFFHTPRSLAYLSERTGFSLEYIKKFRLKPYDSLSENDLVIENYSPIIADEVAFFSFKKNKNI